MNATKNPFLGQGRSPLRQSQLLALIVVKLATLCQNVGVDQDVHITDHGIDTSTARMSIQRVSHSHTDISLQALYVTNTIVRTQLIGLALGRRAQIEDGAHRREIFGEEVLIQAMCKQGG